MTKILILIWSKMDWSWRQTHHQHPDELVNWYPNTADWCMYSTRQVGLMLWLNSPSASYWSQWACMLLTAVDYVVAFRNKPQWWRNHRWHQAVSERGGSEDHRCARCSWAVIQAAFFSFFNSCALTAPLPLTDSNMKNFKIQVEQSTENTLHLTPCPKYWMFRPTEALENKIL